MGETKPITIIGGGLAGLTLGIGLRRQGIPVTVWEAGHYPRHRVCGEFISGRGQEVLARFELWDLLLRAGAETARSAAFFLGQASTPVRAMKPPALCLSRFTLDALLATQFREAGGELREGARWQGNLGEGGVRASGRRVQSVEDGWRWFGLKVHARHVPLVADLEMHGVPEGYVGLCRLHPDEVNVCGLFRRPAVCPARPAPALDLLRGGPGTSLWPRLQNALFVEDSFCAVAGLPLRPKRAAGQAECRLGDALTMIPPVTGNGMSMAFEAAELALAPLAAYSRGGLPWRVAQATIARTCDRAFAQRLAWGQLLQWLMFLPPLRAGLGGVVLGSHWVWRLMLKRTR
jgi:menaquinone-9 beta-reductase